MTMTNHKYYRMAYAAHLGTSFSPERRAESELAWYDETCADFRETGKDWAIEKLTRLFLKSLAAKSRCFSTMIAGPANFPVARMEKYNRWERNASDALFEFVKKVKAPPPAPRTELDYGITAGEFEVAGVRVVKNVDDNRLQLFFAGKPDEAMRDKLKKNGYKWSPRNVCWQRQLTPNALASVRYLFGAQHEGV